MQEHPGVVQGQAASPHAAANSQHPSLLTGRAAWPQQQHENPVLIPATASSLSVEETKTPQEAMDEPPRAVVMKTFGGPDETCEEIIQSHLQSLRKVLAEFLDWKASEEKRHQDYLETSEAERRRIEAEFERLRRLLAEQERSVLGRLAELDDTFTATHTEKSLRVAEVIAQLHRLIGQLEAKCLPQDVESILNSWSEMGIHLPSGLPKELEKSLNSCCRQSDALWEALEEFKDMSSLMGLPTAKTTLEPGTAPLPQLLAEKKSVRWDEEKEQDEAGEPR